MILGNRPDPIEMPSPKCSKCGADMREGFLVDPVHVPYGVPMWVSDQPEFGTFGGAKIDGKEAHSVRTFRCTKCGYLESYGLGNP